jgi:hypothetical protein
MSATHSRNPSDEATASMSYVLEHVLQYPGSYEIPLRTMYTLNCVPRAQPLPKDLSPTASACASPTTAHPAAWSGAESTTMSFTSQLMTHLDSLPTTPSSLPPTFIVNFVTRCFHPTLSLVDFPQALTALDYLRDMENRRRKEMVAAFERVHIHADSYESDMETMAENFPGIALWVRNVEGKNRKCESYYAQLWLGVRRWVSLCLIHSYTQRTNSCVTDPDQRAVHPAIQQTQLHGYAQHTTASHACFVKASFAPIGPTNA